MGAASETDAPLRSAGRQHRSQRRQSAYGDDWHLFLIDHSRAFTERKDINGTTAPMRIEKAYWEKLEALTLDQLQAALGPWLTRGEIAAILVRRDRMREAIQKMAKSRGEANVFF